MKIVLLTAGSRVSPVFETTSNALLIEVIDDRYLIRDRYCFDSLNEREMVKVLLHHQAQLIICGAIPYYLEMELIDQGCEVFSFIAGDIEEVLQALSADLLGQPKFKMPGCKKRKRLGKKQR